jgi:hypothetical protein
LPQRLDQINNMRRKVCDTEGRENENEESPSEVFLDDFKGLRVSEFLDSDIDAEQSLEESRENLYFYTTS